MMQRKLRVANLTKGKIADDTQYDDTICPVVRIGLLWKDYEV